MKIVINTCFGGFGISHKGMKRYAKLKGLNIYPEKNEFGSFKYWLVPKNKRVQPLPLSEHPTTEEICKYNQTYETQVLYDRDIQRDDPALVQMVEELGIEANDKFSNLKVVEIPDGVEWEIDEYDGNEHIAEVHRTWG